ncbi:uncharacterized protein LOC132697224 [Cylas formicarius]|uniref:uncharacterized protein LOC132697224 n=1 Tax=Cylas formicarius TaxID=197179 RepID=UPI0029584950|nr:uncharacterized protein LOC132697224 [Cylas formicarius]XP_060518530.1 uncharacterized protein LOC132697224 [Cylas formicarius]XP_060518531.1 uncharacterized protein LOC132697224 [Cylas formicarius]XP_060518533.1 uncharacterized protein LOC132697224 [Cylas formicarius]XP_060518534.1 uncharacterized protein LOC132697224 [Cylas formicarius]
MRCSNLLVLCLFSAVIAEVHDIETWQPLAPTDLFPSAQTNARISYKGAAPNFEYLGNFGSHLYQTQDLQGKDRCELYKVGFTQDLYFQYIVYKTKLPELKEFTLCFWSKFYNHSNDHPIFSYAVDGQPRAIYSWIANTERSSYFSLSVEGHTFYRLNYPLRLNRWYHTCQSWNGKTGEWQIWVNAERVGRGFHNRLVGHVVPSGGISISGQEQRQPGGGFLEGEDAPKGSGGMLGEITMVQLYAVALTAGKAHKDHKHHHAHQYDHNGNMITTPAPTTPNNRPTLPPHPLLTAGQLNRGTRINLAGAQQQPEIIQGQNYAVQFANGQFSGGLVTQQLSKSVQQIQQSGLQSVQFIPTPSAVTQSVSFGSSLANPANVQYIDNTFGHALFKREIQESSPTSSKHKKRELFVAGGTIVDDGLIGGSGAGIYQQSLLDGLAGIGDNQPILRQQKQNDEREPAEAEVMAVMNVCTGCDEEPFDKALVFGWRTVPKKLFSGAYYMPAVPQCRVF